MAAAARVRCALACAGAVVLLAPVMSADKQWLSDSAAPSCSASLYIRLTMTPDLARGVRAALVREVEGIWRREGVTLGWPDIADTPPGGRPVIRVLVAPGARVAGSQGEHAWPVAELLADQHGQPVAIASADGALRVLHAAGYGREPDALTARRLGLILGRAVAHEIGHYLLNTPVHARRGLMRTVVNARDFADLRSGGFGLGTEEASWARMSLSRGPADELRLARFIYGH